MKIESFLTVFLIIVGGAGDVNKHRLNENETGNDLLWYKDFYGDNQGILW